MILKDDKIGNNAVFFYQDPDPDQVHNDKITDLQHVHHNQPEQ